MRSGYLKGLQDSNSHFDFSGRIRRDLYFEALEHKIEQVSPTGKPQIPREGAQIIKERLPAHQRLPQQSIFGIQQGQDRV